MKRKYSLVALITIVSLLAACSSPTPQVIKEEVVVEKEVPVTVEVEKEVVVEKKVVETVVVEKVITATPKPEPEPTGTLVIAQSEDPFSLDPVENKGAKAVGIMRSIYDTLTQRDPVGPIQPLVAESWEIVDDTTWRFKLRKGIKFTNGEELTGESVQASLQVLRDAESQYAQDFTLIERIDLLDPYTIEIHTTEPWRGLLTQLATLNLLPPAYLAEHGHAYLNQHGVGSGPYKLVEYVRDEYVKLEANEDYWQGPPKIKTVIYRVIPEPSTQIAALLAGEVDMIDKVLPDQVELVEKTPGIELVSMPIFRTVILYMDNRHGGPFADKRVRQAMNYAVDVDSIIEYVLGGRGTRVATFAIPAWEAYDPSIEPYPYDPEKAKELLAEAGYPDGFTTDLQIAIGDHFPVDSAEIVANQLGKVGVTANVVTLEKGAHLDKLKAHKGDPPFFFLSLGGVKTSVAHIAFTALSCEGRWSDHCNPEMDALIAEAMSAMDPAKYAEVCKKIQELAKEEAPYVWLWQHHAIWAYKDRFHDWQPRADQYIAAYGAWVSE